MRRGLNSLSHQPGGPYVVNVPEDTFVTSFIGATDPSSALCGACHPLFVPERLGSERGSELARQYQTECTSQGWLFAKC